MPKYHFFQEELKRRAELARERARIKAQKEDQERTSRAVAGVNHLDIPADLAFVLNKLEGKPLIIISGEKKMKNVNFLSENII